MNHLGESRKCRWGISGLRAVQTGHEINGCAVLNRVRLNGVDDAHDAADVLVSLHMLVGTAPDLGLQFGV